MQLYAYSRGAVGRNLLALPSLRDSVSACCYVFGISPAFSTTGFLSQLLSWGSLSPRSTQTKIVMFLLG